MSRNTIIFHVFSKEIIMQNAFSDTYYNSFLIVLINFDPIALSKAKGQLKCRRLVSSFPLTLVNKTSSWAGMSGSSRIPFIWNYIQNFVYPVRKSNKLLILDGACINQRVSCMHPCSKTPDKDCVYVICMCVYCYHKILFADKRPHSRF